MKRLVLKSVDSTNDYAEQIASKQQDNLLVIANSQIAGRGQFDRTWFSEPGKSVTISFLLRKLKQSSLKQVPHTISSILNKLYGVESEVVLPNDIKINGKKVCGILIETHYESAALEYVVLGIGINLNNEYFPDDIKDIATSIKIETGKEFDAAVLIDKLEAGMEELYD